MLNPSKGPPSTGWWGASTPTVGPDLGGICWYGASLIFDAPGVLRGVRWYLDGADAGSFTWGLRDATSPFAVHCGAVYRNVAGAPGTSRWQNTWFHPFFRFIVGHNYLLIAISESGRFWKTPNALASPPVIHNNVEYWNAVLAHQFNQSDFTLPADAPGIDPLVVWD